MEEQRQCPRVAADGLARLRFGCPPTIPLDLPTFRTIPHLTHPHQPSYFPTNAPSPQVLTLTLGPHTLTVHNRPALIPHPSRSVRSIAGPHICGDALDVQPATGSGASPGSGTSPLVLTGSWREAHPLQLWDLGSGRLLTNLPWWQPEPGACLPYAARFGTGRAYGMVVAGGSGNKPMMRAYRLVGGGWEGGEGMEAVGRSAGDDDARGWREAHKVLRYRLGLWWGRHVRKAKQNPGYCVVCRLQCVVEPWTVVWVPQEAEAVLLLCAVKQSHCSLSRLIPQGSGPGGAELHYTMLLQRPVHALALVQPHPGAGGPAAGGGKGGSGVPLAGGEEAFAVVCCDSEVHAAPLDPGQGAHSQHH